MIVFWERIAKTLTKGFIIVFAVIGAWYSASMIISVNSYMVAPTGIVPAYDPHTGVFKYAEGYPKIAVVVLNDIAKLLDVGKLKAVGVEIVGKTENGVIALLPVRIV